MKKKEISPPFIHTNNEWGKTELKYLKKHYSIDESDQYGDYRVEKSFSCSKVQLKMIFFLEKEKLVYI